METKNEKNIIISITSGSILKIIVFVAAVLLLYILRDMVAVILTSVVIASAVEPAARWFENRRIPRVFGVLFVYLISFLIIGAIFVFIIPPVFSDLSGFTETIPSYLNRPFESATFSSFITSIPESLSVAISDLTKVLEASSGKITSGFFQAASAVFGGALSFILIVVISFYLSVQKGGLENFLRIITPDSEEQYVVKLWRRAEQKIGLWLQGQILLGVLVGILVYLGLTILGVKYALVFAIISALFELIPIFGPIMASIPAIGVAFLESPTLGLMVIGLYLVIQQFENHLIYPLVVKKIIGIPPILVILSLVIGGELAGFFGVLLAIPVATVLMELSKDIAERKHIFEKEI
ncbi:MAG: AI-2E family transporter [Parcubacteria group bacterium]|nr:AI-2E family transporter [Parcubacteria group bacterium]MCR4342482.1 AI-2E family transporter [Patescibacteria group bacterium]